MGKGKLHVNQVQAFEKRIDIQSLMRRVQSGEAITNSRERRYLNAVRKQLERRNSVGKFQGHSK